MHVQGQPARVAVLDFEVLGDGTEHLNQLQDSTDYLQAQVLILGRQAAPQQLKEGQMQQLIYLEMRSNNISDVPEQLFNLPKLKYLSLRDCKQLKALPGSVSSLTELQRLQPEDCTQLERLPDSMNRLRQLRKLALDNWSGLAALPEVFGELTALTYLSLDGCSGLAQLPESLRQLTEPHAKVPGRRSTASSAGFCGIASPPMVKDENAREQVKPLQLSLKGCSSLLQLADTEMPPQQQVLKVLQLQQQLREQQQQQLWEQQQQQLLRQRQQQLKAIQQLTTQQDTMLTTLERMSWLAVLLATATFVAYMSPPGGAVKGQVLVSNISVCSDWQSKPEDDSGASIRSCALLVFFVLDGLSFGFSLGCVMMITIMSMPRIRYDDDDLEAGRFWLLLLFTWVLLYVAVVTGFFAFIASGVAVHNK
jgi:hypothetical protein